MSQALRIATDDFKKWHPFYTNTETHSNVPCQEELTQLMHCLTGNKNDIITLEKYVNLNKCFKKHGLFDGIRPSSRGEGCKRFVQ